MMEEEPKISDESEFELTEEMLMDCSISLHLACVLGCVRLVKQLLAECPAIINAMSSINKLTAVHVAAKHGHEKVLDLLLRSPGLVVAKNSEDRTPCISRPRTDMTRSWRSCLPQPWLDQRTRLGSEDGTSSRDRAWP